MQSTQIHRDTVGAVTVSTVYIEGEDYGYFQTALIETNKPVAVVESWIDPMNPIEAEAAHAVWITVAEKAMAYRER